MTDLRMARLVVSGDALLSVREAARLLGGRGMVEWVERHVRLRYVGGNVRVKWADVLDACPPEPRDEKDPKPRRTAKPRVRLADV